MACSMCCLESCTQLEPLSPGDLKDEPVVDLERIIKDIAWEELLEFPPARLTWRERMCPLTKSVKLELDKAFLDIWPSGSMRFEPPLGAGASPAMSGHGGIVGVPKIERGTTVLFQSSFENNTDSAQTYSFRTERQTRSFVELSLQRGFTVGTSLEVDAKMPTGLEGCEVSGKLGGQLQWSFSRGKTSRQEEQVTWSVDNNILVGPQRIGTASLMVTEYQWSSNFTLPCTIRALQHPVPAAKDKSSTRLSSDADRAKAILEGKDSGSSPGSLHPPGKSRRGGSVEGCGDTRDHHHHGDDSIRDRLDEEEEHDDELQLEEAGTLMSVMTTEANGNSPEPGERSTATTTKPPKAKRPKIPVFVRRKSSGELLKVIYVPCGALVDAAPTHFRLDDADVICDLRGRCHVVCATQQRVRLEECRLAPEATVAGSGGGAGDGGYGGPRGAIVEEYINDKQIRSYRDRYM